MPTQFVARRENPGEQIYELCAFLTMMSHSIYSEIAFYGREFLTILDIKIEPLGGDNDFFFSIFHIAQSV